MAGVAVTTDRAEAMLFTASYLDETVGFVVPDHRRDQFSSWDSIRDVQRLTIAGPNVPYYIDKIRQRLPHAEIRVIDELRPLFEKWDPDIDAVAIPAERGSAWTLLYPQYRWSCLRLASPRSARLSDRRAGPGVCQLHEHMARSQTERRNDPGAL